MNKIFNHLNRIDFSKFLSKKKSTIIELKNKLKLNKEDFNFIETNNDVDNTIITLSLKQIQKLSKIYYYTYHNLSLLKILTNNDYFHKEKVSLPFSTSNLKEIYNKNDDEIVSYFEIESNELEEELNIIHMNLLKKINQNSPNITKVNVAKLLISDNCNLKCSYCFEHTKISTIMSLDIARKLLGRLENNSNINLFGGEPFLHINRMKEIIEWGREYKHLRFSISTNGQIIDREFFRDYCKNITMMVSIDGPEYIHDLNRGKGSWKKAIEFYHAFYEETGKYPSITITINENCIPYFYECTKWLYEFEMNTFSNKKITQRYQFSNPKDWNPKFLIELEKQLDMIVNWYIEKEIYKTNWSLAVFKEAESLLLHNISIVKEKHCIDKNINILPSGDIVPCFRAPWIDDKYFITSSDPNFIEYYSAIKKSNIEQCSDCEAWGCSTGCVAEFQKTENNLFKPGINFCNYNKLFIKKAHELVNKIHKNYSILKKFNISHNNKNYNLLDRTLNNDAFFSVKRSEYLWAREAEQEDIYLEPKPLKVGDIVSSGSQFYIVYNDDFSKSKFFGNPNFLKNFYTNTYETRFFQNKKYFLYKIKTEKPMDYYGVELKKQVLTYCDGRIKTASIGDFLLIHRDFIFDKDNKIHKVLDPKISIKEEIDMYVFFKTRFI